MKSEAAQELFAERLRLLRGSEDTEDLLCCIVESLDVLIEKHITEAPMTRLQAARIVLKEHNRQPAPWYPPETADISEPTELPEQNNGFLDRLCKAIDYVFQI